MDSSSSSTSSSFNFCELFNCSKSDLVKSGFYRTKLFDNLVCCECGWESGRRNLSLKHINFVHKLCNPNCELSNNFQPDFNTYAKLKTSVLEMEHLMKETFLSWSKPYPRIDKLVEAGFYYTGKDDATACVTCGLVLDEWTTEDDPIEEHRVRAPFCELIMYLNK